MHYKDKFQNSLLKHNHQYIYSTVYRMMWMIVNSCFLAELPFAFKGVLQKISMSSFITFWYPATVHRWQYLPSIVSHLLLCLCILLLGFMQSLHQEKERHFSYSNSSAPFALRSPLSSCSLVIRREHTLPINNDLNVFNKRVHTTSTPWLQYHQPHLSLLS